MSRIKTIVIPLTAAHPLPDEGYFQDGWSVDIILDMDFIRKVQPLLDEAAEHLKGERDAGDLKSPLELIEALRCGPGSFRATLKYAGGDDWAVPLEHYHTNWRGSTEFWGHPARRSIELSWLFNLIKEAEEYPDWALVNPHTVRCDDTLVTTITGFAAYNDKKASSLAHNYQHTLYHQIDQAGSLGWVPVGMQHLYGHNDAGAPIPSAQLASILALARIEGKENWAMYKVLHRLYKKLGGKDE